MSTYETRQFPGQNGIAVGLRALRKEDAGALRSLLAHPELSTHIILRGEGTQQGAMNKLAHRMSHIYDPCALHAGIHCGVDSALIGTVSLQCWNRRNGTAILGYMLSPEWWGRGYATEAVGLMLNYGIHEMGITEVEGRCRDSNLRSARVMIKNGMKLKRVIPIVGSAGDEIKVFSLLHK